MKVTRHGLLLGFVLCAACSGDRTEVIVVSDTDIPVPDGIEAIRFVVTGPGGDVQTATTDLSNADLPATVGLVHRGGPLGPFVVEASGTLAGAVVVQRTVRFTFVKKMTLMVRVDLFADCIGLGCGAGDSCGPSGCASIDVPESALLPWPGQAPRFDGTTTDSGVLPDAPPCSLAEVCNGEDEDCDGMVDEDFDLMTDANHCGGCNQLCAPMNAVPQCVGGVCGFSDCMAGFGDCDDEPMTGCETPILTDPEHCGGCGTVCEAPPNAMRLCMRGICSVGGCDAGFGNCDGNPDNGCEQPLDGMSNCGACGSVCDFENAEQACVAGVCQQMGCAPGYDDCFGDAGCERYVLHDSHCGRCGNRCVGNSRECSLVDVDAYSCTNGCTAPAQRCANGACADVMTDPQHCGTCGNACPAPFGGVATCAGGVCGIACDSNWHDCNADPSDGCESDLSSAENCGACGMPCVMNNAVGGCKAGSCELLACDDGFANCNDDPRDGCERPLGTTTDCSACGDTCLLGETCRDSGSGLVCQI